MKAGRESDIVSGCLRLLEMHGIMAWRVNNIPPYDPVRKRFRRFRGLKGVADILGIVTRGAWVYDSGWLDLGVLLAVECKSRTGRLTAAQRAFLDEVTRRGGLALVVRDVGQLEAGLRAEGVI